MVADQEPVATESILKGPSPAEFSPRLAINSTVDLGGAKTPEGTFGMQYEGEKSWDVPIVKVLERLAGKLVEHCTSDFMESDDIIGGAKCINGQDLEEDLEEKNAAANRKGDENSREKLLTRIETEVNTQNYVADREVIHRRVCMEPHVEDPILNMGVPLVNGKLTSGNSGSHEGAFPSQQKSTEQGVCSGSSLPNHGNNGDYEKGLASNEDITKTSGKVRKWKRKTRDNISDNTCKIQRKRKFEDVEWTLSDT